MEKNIYVKLIGPGGELSCEGFDNIADARKYIAEDLVFYLYTGDKIVIAAAENM